MSLLPLEPGSWQAELAGRATEILDTDRKLRKLGLNAKKDWLNEEQLNLRRDREVLSANPIDRLIESGLYRRSYNPLAGKRPTRRGRYSERQDPWRQDGYESFDWDGHSFLPAYNRPDRLVEGGQHYTWDIMLPHRDTGGWGSLKISTPDLTPSAAKQAIVQVITTTEYRINPLEPRSASAP